jgi:hypothetical protein
LARTANWTKVTCRTGRKFDGVYLARRKEDGLLYAGKVEMDSRQRYSGS